MKRMRVLFALPFLLLALPVWRWMDFIAWLAPLEGLYSVVFFFWGLLFLVLPSWLIKPKIVPLIVLALVFALSIGSYFTKPLSKAATRHPELNHCGNLTFTGFLYPAINILTQAPADDLDARNQLCWIKKLMRKVPNKFDTPEEYEAYQKHTQNMLLMPENKYRVGLPMIAMLSLVIMAEYNDNYPMKNARQGINYVQGLKFWIEQYTVEISSRTYSWWDFPYGPYIQFEYGLVERNWESIVNSIVLSEE